MWTLAKTNLNLRQPSPSIRPSSFHHVYSTHIQIFAAVAKGDLTGIPPLDTIFTEYIADIHVAVEADIFIGSHSNVYALAASMVSLLLPTHFVVCIMSIVQENSCVEFSDLQSIQNARSITHVY